MFQRVISVALAVAGLLALAGVATAQGGLFDEPEATKISFAARFDPPKAKPGQEVDFVVEISIVDGWHVYGSLEPNAPPIELVIEEPFGLESAGEVRVPTGRRVEKGGIESFWLENTFELRKRMRVEEGESEGELTASGEVNYMICDPSVCLPPDSATVEASLEILAADSDIDTSAELPPDRIETERPGTADSIDWGELILLAIGAGLLALAMPCTYPMVPITFSFFTKQADARGGNVLPLALTYGLGIVSIFVVIGVVFGPVIVPFATHPVTNGVIGIVFVVFALALFGLINLQPPAALQNLANQASSKGGYLGVFLMGLCLVVSSFTCTVPFVGTMLSLSAAGGMAKVIVGMAVFGLTMALPFVALSLIPGKVSAMPRAGEWMNTLKVTLGFVELAAALKFFSNVDLVVNNGIQDAWISRELFAGIWAAIFAITAIYLFGAFSRGSTIGLKRRLTGLAFAGIAFYCGMGATGRELNYVMSAILPPSLHKGRHEIVLEDIQVAFDKAIAADKLLLINFTGLT